MPTAQKLSPNMPKHRHPTLRHPSSASFHGAGVYHALKVEFLCHISERLLIVFGCLGLFHRLGALSLPRLKTIACWWTSVVVLLFIAQAITFTVQPYL